MREAFGDATRRLALTGTPFRSDDSPIPFVNYEPDGEGLLRSRADHTYGYAEALADGVVRPVVFMAYSGEARWRDSAGEGTRGPARRATERRTDRTGVAHGARPGR